MNTFLSIIPYKVFPAQNGGQRNIAYFNQFLAEEVPLICVTVKENLPSYTKDYKIFNILSDSPLRYINIFYTVTFLKIIKKNKITHVILDHPYYGWLGIILKWITGIKLIIHSQNIEHNRWKSLGKWWWKILYWYERYVHKLSDYNFFIQTNDLNFAIENFKLDKKKCTLITYGIEWDVSPNETEKNTCKAHLQKKYNIPLTEKIILFNGTLNYKPNLFALKAILQKINPILLASSIKYKIIICGSKLPAEMDELKEYTDKNIIYAGFVNDISTYFKGADIFLNPTIDGGGIKTKLVEALGYNTTSISTENGAIGIDIIETGSQLTIVADNDWINFSKEIIKAASKDKTSIPASFYKKFYWGNIVKKAVAFINC